MALQDDLNAAVAQLEADVAAQDTVIDSAETFIAGVATQIATLNGQIADLQAQINAGSDQALKDAVAAVIERSTALHTTLVAKTSELAAAIPAGTPAETPVP